MNPSVRSGIQQHPMRCLYALMITMGFVVGCHDDPPVVYPTVAPFDPTKLALGPGDKLELTIFYGNKESKATYSLDASGQRGGSVMAYDLLIKRGLPISALQRVP